MIQRPTKKTSRREAEAIEREKARYLAQQDAARISLRLDDVAGRYYQEVGHHLAGDGAARMIEGRLELIIERLGKDKLITDVTDADVADLISWRCGHRGRSGGFLSPATVNDTTMTLNALFTFSKRSGVRFDHEPNWRTHWLPEPANRVRELVGDEAERLEAATPENFAPFFAFARASGLRFSECFLRWSQVDWKAGQIRRAGKGDRLVTTPITSTVRAILWPLRGHHPEFVFTYVAEGAWSGRVKGQRYPLNRSLARRAWIALRAKAGVTDFRFHDFRHDLATKVLRETGNLKVAQRALNHVSITSTLRYAHVLDGDVRNALERIQSPKKSRRSVAIIALSRAQAARNARKCEVCGEPLLAKRATTRFCSGYCRLVAHRRRIDKSSRGAGGC
jgi:integrase